MNPKAGLCVLAFVCVLGPAALAYSATVPAANCTQAAVATAVGQASPGDTVAIPAGTCTWTGTVTVTKPLTLQGAGAGLTTIQDGVQSGYLLDLELVAGRATRLTGIQFQDGGRTTVTYNGVIVVGWGGLPGTPSDGRTIRIDHCNFVNLNGTNAFYWTVLGVVDHNTFTLRGGTIAAYIYHDQWNGGTNADGAWAAPPNMGSGQFLFFEDNTVTHPPGPGNVYIFADAYRGARYVVRHNTLTNTWIEMHGSDSAGRPRGTRAVEVYNNIFHGDPTVSERVINIRSGIVYAHDNAVDNFMPTVNFKLAVYRSFYPFSPFGGGDGTNVWDANTPGGPFATGTVGNCGSCDTTHLTVSPNPNWTTNQWAGYSVKKTSPCVTERCYDYIISNTANTLTMLDDGGFCFGCSAAQQLSWSTGETFQIWRVANFLDQPGRGQGTQLVTQPVVSLTSAGTTAIATVTAHGYSTGNYVAIDGAQSTSGNYNGTFQITVTSANTFTYAMTAPDSAPGGLIEATVRPAGWNNQVNEPSYEWNNTCTSCGGTTAVHFNSDAPLQIVQGVHYFNSAVAPNYTPYTYPHPLVQGTAAPSAPTNLRIVP
jgi:hypothetical protein